METRKAWVMNENGSWDLIEHEITGYNDGILQLGKVISREYSGFFNGPMPNPNEYNVNQEKSSNNIPELEKMQNDLNTLMQQMEDFINGKEKQK